MTGPKRRPLIQWVLIAFLMVVVGVGIWFARSDPDTDWGPIILGALGLIGFVIRGLFKTPEDTDDDGYGTGYVAR